MRVDPGSLKACRPSQAQLRRRSPTERRGADFRAATRRRACPARLIPSLLPASREQRSDVHTRAAPERQRARGKARPCSPAGGRQGVEGVRDGDGGERQDEDAGGGRGAHPGGGAAPSSAGTSAAFPAPSLGEAATQALLPAETGAAPSPLPAAAPAAAAPGAPLHASALPPRERASAKRLPSAAAAATLRLPRRAAVAKRAGAAEGGARSTRGGPREPHEAALGQ